MREPAVANQEAYELLGSCDALAAPEHREAIERGLDGERLATTFRPRLGPLPSGNPMEQVSVSPSHAGLGLGEPRRRD
jgi:hypothetical protein